MPAEKLRTSFTAYLKSPHRENLRLFIHAATSGFLAVNPDARLSADDYMPKIHDVVKEATKGIKINISQAKQLEDLSRYLSLSDDIEDNLAFPVMAMLVDLTHPHKICLRELVANLMLMQQSFSMEESFLNTKILSGAWYVKPEDLQAQIAKTTIVDEWLQVLFQDIFARTHAIDTKEMQPASSSFEVISANINSHIFSLTKKECEQVITNFLEQLLPVLNANTDEERTKRNLLMVHSFFHQPQHPVLSKILKWLREFLGIKTQTIQTLEMIAEDIKFSCKR